MKNFVVDFKTGISTYFEAARFIVHQKMGRYFLFPIVLSLVLAVLVFLLRIQVHDYIESYLVDLLDYDQWWDWAKSMTSWLIHLSIFVLTWYLYYKFQKYLLLIVLSPVLAYVSEKTEQLITNKAYSFDVKQFIKDIVRGVLIASRNLLLELTFTLLLFLLGLIPLFTPFTGVLILVIGWYYSGYSILDYTNERRKLSIAQGNQLIKQKKGLAISNGMVFELIFLIPIIGFVIAPILSSVAGTIALLKTETKS